MSDENSQIPGRASLDHSRYLLDRADALCDFQRQVFHDRARQLTDDALSTGRWTLATCFLANAGAAGLAAGIDQIDPETLRTALNFWAQGAAYALISGPLSTTAATFAANQYQDMSISTQAEILDEDEESPWPQRFHMAMALIGVAALTASIIAFWRGASVFL